MYSGHEPTEHSKWVSSTPATLLDKNLMDLPGEQERQPLDILPHPNAASAKTLSKMIGLSGHYVVAP